jgi:hypothetical protein
MVITPQEHKTAIVSAQVSSATRDELRRRAHEGDRSLSAEVRRALTAYLGERIAVLEKASDER